MIKLKPMLDRYDVVLIDTAGRSHKNAQQRDDLRKLINSIDEKASDATDEIPTIIIVIGETIPASTAAWPKTKAPTIEIELPPLPGKRISLSLNIWNIKLITIISKTVEKGTPSLWIEKFIKRPLGIASKLYAINDM